MTNQNIWALLVNDDDPFFIYGSQKFVRYLRDELNVPASRIEIIIGTTEMIKRSRSFLRNFARENDASKLVVIYSAHPLFGPKTLADSFDAFTGRLPSEKEIAKFAEYFPTDQDLGNAIKQALGEHGEFMFINVADYSGRAINIFKEIDLIPQRGLVITACGEQEEHHYPYFLEEVVGHYRYNRPFAGTEIPPLVDTGKALVLHSPELTQTLLSRIRYRLKRVATGAETLTIDTTLGLIQHEVQIAMPKIIRPGQHPMRYGKDLDYLLFPS